MWEMRRVKRRNSAVLKRIRITKKAKKIDSKEITKRELILTEKSGDK